ncbi:uncharacterized protein LOC132311054 isoform X2 [Cornus florida]|uniref:uncharacterized protein LOC132311054 isoform X2 n=1 Tax=Cornus florida TaxID=4283 RepID=UPI00289BB5D2|nr:uncharacterized protein LOC132311054 isoform X2 [Cornus florida]
MVIFPGNLVCKTSFWHQRLVLLVPWLKLSQFPGNTCSRCRVYCSSSSFPVRYIPNQSSKAKETKTSPLPITGSEDEEMRSDSDPNISRVEVSNGSHRSFVLDEKSQSQQNQNQTLINKFTFGTKPGVEEEEVGCDLGIADHKLLEDLEELKIHQGKDPRNQDALLEGKTKQDAENLAIEFLATRAFTAVELRKKLHGKRFHLDTVDAVIKDFQGRGFINDCLYAETFSRSRWSSLKWGPMRIKKVKRLCSWMLIILRRF